MADVAAPNGKMMRLGSLLRELRAKRGWDKETDVWKRLTRPPYSLKIDGAKYQRLEDGDISKPDVVILWALSQLYQEPFELFLKAIVADRIGATRADRIAVERRELADWAVTTTPYERAIVETIRDLNPTNLVAVLTVLRALAPPSAPIHSVPQTLS
jgi:transcriptional regulator with XRE-family HTH domain